MQARRPDGPRNTLPHLVSRSGALWRQVFRETLSNWSAHDAFTQSAALAFYTLFSLSPLLILVIAVAAIPLM